MCPAVVFIYAFGPVSIRSPFSLAFSDMESFDPISKYWSAYCSPSAIPHALWLLCVCSLVRGALRVLRSLMRGVLRVL